MRSSAVVVAPAVLSARADGRRPARQRLAQGVGGQHPEGNDASCTQEVRENDDRSDVELSVEDR